ncbi:hypothetical protein [Tenacibaculum sp. 190524A05c]|uniref:hypothetical protein n=1 Tax=Tenacibaculum platacis TaxID=3137852 RepID=UPI0032B2A873
MATTKKVSLRRQKFDEKYKEYSLEDLQKEALYTQKLLLEKTERVRANTYYLVVFLVVIPIVAGVLALVL